MVSELTAEGAGSTARIEVSNVGAAPLPFETTVSKIDFDDKGGIIETPADQDFLVFPPQGLVPVGGHQVVRVQWVGDPKISVSRAYYLSVRQLPVATTTKPESGGGVALQVVYHMKALITVAPKGAEPKVEVVSASPEMVASTPPPPTIEPSLTGGVAQAPPKPPATVMVPGLRIRVRNTGTRYAMMSGATWHIDGVGADGKPINLALTGSDINQAVGVGYLAPAGGERTFDVPTGATFAADKPVKVRFSQ
jgi:fimbrial chaperone protein